MMIGEVGKVLCTRDPQTVLGGWGVDLHRHSIWCRSPLSTATKLDISDTHMQISTYSVNSKAEVQCQKESCPCICVMYILSPVNANSWNRLK